MKTLKILAPTSLPFASRQTDTPLEWGRHFFMENQIDELTYRDIPGYEGLYQVNGFGVKSVARDTDVYINGKLVKRPRPEAILKLQIKRGYVTISLCKDGKKKMFRFHRLKAKMYIPNPENKPFINHKNGIKDDNRLENLEWCTHQENMRHATDMGLKIIPSGSASRLSKEVHQFTMNGGFVKSFGSGQEAERETGISRSNIIYNIKGERNHAGGFIWKRA
jgi:hypothetical protein